ncbi:MAG TPA: hypothetical protein VFQ68_22250 [Streptosporangiaceae bacterium]|nr:hypothetical protein [Streptosporangiaceae bacterium]
MNETEARLARIRGRTLAKTHNARTIAALASNPGCARRAIMDAAGADKQRIAACAGFPAPFGQSRFALGRGNAFEAQVKADGAAELLTLLRDHLNLPIPEAHYDDLSEVGGSASLDLRHARTRALLARAATAGTPEGTMFDHPLLRLEVGGRHAFLEPDLIAFQVHGRFRVVEIKSFAVIDGQADGAKVAAAAIQSAVYVLALRGALAEQGVAPEAVSHETILVCPRDFSNRPVATSLDVRKQLTVLGRQLSRIARIDDLLDLLPNDLTFDLDPDGGGAPRRSPADLTRAIQQIDARYAPECLSRCEMCFFCRDEARGCTAALGRDAREELGGVEHIETVLRLARDADAPADLAEAAGLLRTAARLRGETLAEAS